MLSLKAGPSARAPARLPGRLQRPLQNPASLLQPAARAPARLLPTPPSATKGASPEDGPEGARRHVRPRKRSKARKPKARLPGQFEVQDVAPPPRSLGVHALPPSTHNGDLLQIDGQEYVVTSLILQYKLERGRYVRDHNKLEVLRAGRFLYNEFLSSMMAAPPGGSSTSK